MTKGGARAPKASPHLAMPLSPARITPQVVSWITTVLFMSLMIKLVSLWVDDNYLILWTRFLILEVQRSDLWVCSIQQLAYTNFPTPNSGGCRISWRRVLLQYGAQSARQKLRPRPLLIKTTPIFERFGVCLTCQSIHFWSWFLLRWAIEAGFLVLQAERGAPFSLSSVLFSTNSSPKAWKPRNPL